MSPRVSALAVPVLLVAVAAAQITAAYGGALSPWKGGGFGMFATVDQPARRSVAMVAVGRDGQTYRVSIPFGRFNYPEPLSSAFVLETVTLPTEERLRRLAETVLKAHLLPSTRDPDVLATHLAHSRYRTVLQSPAAVAGDLDLVSPFKGETSFPDVREIRVAVIRLRFDVSTHHAVFEPVGPRVTVYAPAS